MHCSNVADYQHQVPWCNATCLKYSILIIGTFSAGCGQLQQNVQRWDQRCFHLITVQNQRRKGEDDEKSKNVGGSNGIGGSGMWFGDGNPFDNVLDTHDA
jgi:hypothetical protein